MGPVGRLCTVCGRKTFAFVVKVLPLGVGNMAANLAYFQSFQPTDFCLTCEVSTVIWFERKRKTPPPSPPKKKKKKRKEKCNNVMDCVCNCRR